MCPVSAIYAEGDLAEKWNTFLQTNAEHFGKSVSEKEV